MQRLEALGAHSLAHRRGRSVLTALGIVLGVAVLFGVLVTSDAVNRAFQDLVRSYTGRSDVSMGPVGDWQSGLAPATADQVRKLPGVELVSTGWGGQIRIRTDAADQFLRLEGVDGNATKISEFKLTGGRLATEGANELVLPKKLDRKSVV